MVLENSIWSWKEGCDFLYGPRFFASAEGKRGFYEEDVTGSAPRIYANTSGLQLWLHKEKINVRIHLDFHKVLRRDFVTRGRRFTTRFATLFGSLRSPKEGDLVQV